LEFRRVLFRSMGVADYRRLVGCARRLERDRQPAVTSQFEVVGIERRRGDDSVSLHAILEMAADYGIGCVNGSGRVAPSARWCSAVPTDRVAEDREPGPVPLLGYGLRTRDLKDAMPPVGAHALVSDDPVSTVPAPRAQVIDVRGYERWPRKTGIWAPAPVGPELDVNVVEVIVAHPAVDPVGRLLDGADAFAIVVDRGHRPP